jgi:putative tryptophan/tyrosine transport system substrate-binding protein
MEEKNLPQEASIPGNQGVQVSRKKIYPWVIIFTAILLVIFVTMGFLFFSLHGTKQATETKIYHVGILSGLEGFVHVADGFKQGMTKLGYIEGKNIEYDLQRLDDNPQGEVSVLKKFVEDKVDLIFSFPTGPSIEAKEITKGTHIPVVFAVAGTEKNNLITSISQPGGNITGVRFPLRENTPRRLEILHEIAPNAKRIYLTYDANYPNTKAALEALHAKAPELGLTLVEDPVNNIEELIALLKKRSGMKDIGADAVLIMPDVLSHSEEGINEIITKFANKYNLPVAGCMSNTVDEGAIFSFFPDSINEGVLAAGSADKVLKGTPAGTIPVITPESYLIINYKAIQKLGLSVSDGLLSRADKIIR